jgi:hypothetical protein
MYDFLDDLGAKSNKYWQLWDSFRKQHNLQDFKPSTVAYKAQDIEDFNQILGSLLEKDLANQCHIGFVDKRYIASIVLRKPVFFKDVRIVNLMQRRLNSTDPVGLDHMDFYVNSLAEIENEFKKKGLKGWEYESNESHRWISLKFDDTEAKFVDHLVLDVCVKELNDTIKNLGFKPKAVA